MENIKNKITLIRHGKPETHEEYSTFSIISRKDIEKFIKAYDTCGLIKIEIPSTLKEIISSGDLFISSSLKRSVNHIIVMAHGFVNRLMKKELLKRGWKQLSNKGRHGYWSYTSFGKV